MRHYITVFEGNEKIQTYLLNVLPAFETGRITVGRLPENDIVLPYQSVSRKHAVIEFRGGVVDIVDAGSLNKLRVNGVAYERIRLADGLEVTIGTSTNTISLKYTAIADPVPEKSQPGVTKTDDGTAIFDLSELRKEKQQSEKPKKQPSAEEIDDVWSPMPKGTSHKAVPVSPLNSRGQAITGELSGEEKAGNPVSPTKQEKPKTQPEASRGDNPADQPHQTQKITKAFVGRRFIAFMADFVICAFMIVGAAFILLMSLNQLGIKVIALFTFIIAILVSWVYYALCESGASGATLGKMALGLKVVDAKTMQTVDAKIATKRFFSKILSALILFIGFLPIFGKKQTFHDYLSGTKVIKNN